MPLLAATGLMPDSVAKGAVFPKSSRTKFVAVESMFRYRSSTATRTGGVIVSPATERLGGGRKARCAGGPAIPLALNVTDGTPVALACTLLLLLPAIVSSVQLPTVAIP